MKTLLLEKLEAQVKARGLKSEAIDESYSCLSAIYEFLIIERLVEYNPILPFRKYYIRRYKNDSDSEIHKLIGVDDASRRDSQDKCMLVLFFKTGMRVGQSGKLALASGAQPASLPASSCFLSLSSAFGQKFLI